VLFGAVSEHFARAKRVVGVHVAHPLGQPSVRQDAHCFAVLLRIIPAQGRTGKEAQQWLRPDGSERWKKTREIFAKLRSAAHYRFDLADDEAAAMALREELFREGRLLPPCCSLCRPAADERTAMVAQDPTRQAWRRPGKAPGRETAYLKIRSRSRGVGVRFPPSAPPLWLHSSISSHLGLGCF
jgi:hypothetical protein